MSSWFPCAAIGLASTIGIPVFAARPLDANFAAGVFPPWWSSAQVLSAAGSAGEIVGVGSLPFIVVVGNEAGNVNAQLRAAGALINLDRFGLAGCITR